MSTFQIIRSIGVKSNRAIERCTNHSKRKCTHTPVEQLGFSKAQCERILAMQEELRQFSTTC